MNRDKLLKYLKNKTDSLELITDKKSFDYINSVPSTELGSITIDFGRIVSAGALFSLISKIEDGEFDE